MKEYTEQEIKDGSDFIKSRLRKDVTRIYNRALELAAENGQLEILKWLLNETEASVEEAEEDYFLFLRREACRGHLDVLEFLTKIGVRIL